jgi:membrane dipeptidase
MKRIVRKILKWVLYIIILFAILIGLRIVLGMAIQEMPKIEHVDNDIRDRVLKLHHDSIVFDGHNDIPDPILFFDFDLGMNGDEPDDVDNWWLWTDVNTSKYLPFRPTGDSIRTHTDLARIREGGLDAQFFSIWVDCALYRSNTPNRSKQRVFDMTKAFQKQVQKYPDAIEMAYTSNDIRRIVSNNKLAALFGLEGGHAIEHDISNLRHFYELGIRYISLTHFCTHDWADSATDKAKWNGLSDFGQEVVKEMNHLGIVVDVSHSSDETFWDVVRTTKAPIMASHSCARAIVENSRNMTDDMIQAVAKSGGIVMINFMTPMLDPEKSPFWKSATGWHWFWNPRHPETPLSMLVDHIDHVVKVAGIDHVGIGSDFDGIPFSPYWLPEGLKDVGDLPNITIELISRGYKDEDIRKILGSNMLRVLGEVEAIAVKLAN